MKKILDYVQHLDDFALSIAFLGLAILIGIIVWYALFRLLRFYNKRHNPYLVKSLTENMGQPLAFFLPLLSVSILLPGLLLTDKQLFLFRRIVETLNIIAFAWILINLTDVARDIVRRKFEIDQTDNMRIRKLFTQLTFLKRLTVSIIVFIAIALILLTFESVRKLGTGLLTSAGVAGIVIGFAAQRSIANLLAGLQLAFTQPIRIDDVLVVEGEWGRVEEITLTYVVLRIWDNRRLILPLNYFIEKPFQNWTRTGSDLLATVYLYTDYTVPIDAIRAELGRILDKTDLWDRRVSGLQVTDSKERTLELRVLVSANNSSLAWDLRCLVREKLILFIQLNYPDALPKIRTELTGSHLQSRN
ncbi:mechanosensitive ion channel family protein [Pontibacter sp. CAU 1760]